MRDFILRHTPEKYLPKSKIKSPRNQVCKINKNDGPIIYLVYVKLTNILPITKKDNDGLSKYDLAGVFQTWKDAHYVADCLNKIFSWYHVYDDKYKLASQYFVRRSSDNYYMVQGYYQMIGNIKRKKFTTDQLMAIVTDVNKLQSVKDEVLSYIKDEGNRYLRSVSSKNTSKIHLIPYVHVMRYKLNDVMPTMELDDYSIQDHKKHLEIIKDELQKYPQRKKMKSVLEDVDLMKHAPPSRVLPKGGIDYRELTNDPEFKKRWAPWDKTINP